MRRYTATGGYRARPNVSRPSGSSLASRWCWEVPPWSRYSIWWFRGVCSLRGVLTSLVGTTAFYIFTLLIPLSIAVAVLRYHLYDIDTLINRTLVYGSLSVTLVALYFGGIVLLQRLFVVLTGEKSTLAVVASTLLIAALFTPLRRRIQAFIDRRFYRRKYDARKTLEAFSLKLRDETDLDAVSDDLVGVVRETMQPAHVSLWLSPEPTPHRKQTG